MPEAVYDARDNGPTLSVGYARRRQPDPRIAAAITAALAGAHTIVNIGDGAGSYEPAGHGVTAVEPSAQMIAQRPADAAPCVRAAAEALPFADASFDAAMAILTIHHWSDWRRGLLEMRRVARDRVVLLTFDAEAADFWLTRDYFPEIAAHDRHIMPLLSAMKSELGAFSATPLPVPHDCIDGFLGSYWRRPEIYLDPSARRSMSSFARIDAGPGLQRLASDIRSGVWRAHNADLLTRDALDIGYRLLRWELS